MYKKFKMSFLQTFVSAFKAGFGAIFIFLMMRFSPGKMKENAKKLKLDDKLKAFDGTMEFGWKMLKGIFDVKYNQSFHVSNGDDVPGSIDLIDLDSKSKINLKDLCKSNIPIVLNFGSCT